MDPVAQIRKKSLADSAILSRAILDSFRKLNPRTMVKNPVMFVVEVGAVLTTIQLAWNASHHAGEFGFGLQITLWLWFTVLFAPATPAATETIPVPRENNSVTEHELTLNGKALRYSAAAGNLVIDDEEEKPYGTIFYVAYTLSGVTDPRTRPVTFLYNGGPGSCSLWLHMGSVGPVRVVTSSPEATGSAPFKIVPNEY